MKFRSDKKIVISFILLTVALNNYSQAIEKKTYNTVFTKTAPVIDGLINDECWDQAEWSGDFIQSLPYENKPPSQQTAFKILYDDDNLYVFIRAYDTEPGKISRILSRRDYFDGDRVSIKIDSYFDKQTAFSFTAMASGAKADQLTTQDGNSNDVNWNPIWYLNTAIDDKGWCAEMKIPFSQLRFGQKEEHVWGIQISRNIFRLQESSAWQFIPKGSPGTVHLFGELHGIKHIKPKHHIELLPYSVGRIERFQKEAGNPFMNGKSSALSFGLDGKAAITNDLTLDFSINPDFGQVEADPSEVNLSAFESYFSERRPLFVEGRNIYQFEPSNMVVINNMSTDNLFYSRRIGQYPQYYPEISDNEYLEMPKSTRIISALKLSGKTKKGFSIGILESVTASEEATIDSVGIRRKVSVEPLTNYFVGRVQQDFNKGETILGGIITAVNRDINSPELNYLHSAAYTGGIDFRRNWKARTWYLAGNAEFSNVKGKQEAIITTQMSSARYFQRPDANYLSVDSTLTSLAGYGGTVKLGKVSQKKWQYETSFTLRSPGLELNDIGYMRYTDIIHHGTWVGYYLRDPFSIFNNFFLNMNYCLYWNFSGKLLSKYTNVNFNSQFKNRWGMNGNVSRKSESISTTLLRGGPSFKNPGTEELNLNFYSDQSKKISFFLGNYHGFGDSNSFRYHEYYSGIYIRPMNSISVSLEPSYSISNSNLQYINTTSDNNDPRYLFGELSQKTVSFTFRVNYTINPELTIEYFGQPFISAGKYTNFKRITENDADKYNQRYHIFTSGEIQYIPADNTYSVDENRDGTGDYFIENPDYNFRQFLSNLVVRWEYLPGSTIYLVWSQGKTNNASNGLFSYGNDMRELFNTISHNVFLLKFSYWFSI